MSQTSSSRGPSAAQWLMVLGLVYMLLVGVGVIGEGFKILSGGSDGAAQIFAFAENPLIGVILGVLATALVQSSSTVTSVIVGLVAGGVPLTVAIPMIMGANMGTTITNTIVSLGSIRCGKSFNRAFQAATVHDFFNLFCILIFLPLELMFKPLQTMSAWLTDFFLGGGELSIGDLNIIGAATKPASNLVVDVVGMVPGSLGATLIIVAGIAMVICSVMYLGKVLASVMRGAAKNVLDTAVGRGPIAGVASGAAVTVMVQSSSTTTSLVVPLAGAGILTTRQVFPFTMGANIGTTITALMAATAITGEFEAAALQVALVHLLYNVLGVLVFLIVPVVRDMPVRAAEWLGARTEQSRGWAFGYIFGLFFAVPGLVFLAQDSRAEEQNPITEAIVATEAPDVLEQSALEESLLTK